MKHTFASGCHKALTEAERRGIDDGFVFLNHNDCWTAFVRRTQRSLLILYLPSGSCSSVLSVVGPIFHASRLR